MRKLISIVLISVFCLIYAGDKTYKVKTDSRGVKTFYNKNKPADPNFKIELKKLGEISYDYLDSLGEDIIGPKMIRVHDYEFDKDGNFIILDYNRMWKFDKNFRYIKKWSRKGYGPGEIINPFHFHMNKDTIYVLSSGKVIKFDAEGKFINDIQIKDRSDFPWDIFFCDNNLMLGSKTGYKVETRRKTDKIMLYETKTFKVGKTLFEREYKKRGSTFSNDDEFIYAGDEKVFFVVDNSYNEYKINCYDSKTGKLKYKIRKNHIKVENDEEVKDHYGVYDGKKVKFQTGTSKFKEAINGMFYDKYDRLWVNPNSRDIDNVDDRSMYFDIFKDGIFINRIKLDLNYSYIYGFKLNGNKIVQYGGDGYVDIYEFK